MSERSDEIMPCGHKRFHRDSVYLCASCLENEREEVRRLRLEREGLREALEKVKSCEGMGLDMSSGCQRCWENAKNALKSLPAPERSRRERAKLSIRRTKEFHEYWVDIDAGGEKASINLGNCQGPLVSRALKAALDAEPEAPKT